MTAEHTALVHEGYIGIPRYYKLVPLTALRGLESTEV